MTRTWIKPVPAVVSAIFALGAVTAVAVAPNSAADLPPPTQTVRDTLDIPMVAADAVDRFIQSERIRRGDSLASLLSRLGALDVDFQRFVAGNATADLLEALRRRRGERESAVVEEVDPRGAHPSTGSIRLVDLPEDEDAGMRQTGPQPRGRRNRPTMPSWDEIVFGTKPDDDLA